MTTERPQGLIESAARKGGSRQMNQMASFRTDAALLREVRRLAAAEGIGAGTWMRRAVSNAVFDAAKPPEIPGYRVTGRKCPHLAISAGGYTLGAATANCGCEMTPVYEPVLAAA